MMKKITFLLAAFVFTFSFAEAQKLTRSGNVQTDAKFDKTFQADKGTVADTLYPASFLSGGTPSLYTTSKGGYVFGINGYGDLAKAQVFENSNRLNISGFGVWIGAKEIEGTADDVAFNLYEMGEDGPGDVIAFAMLSTAEFDTTGYFTFVEFESPVEVTKNFAVGLDFTAVDDTFGIVSTVDGDAGGADLSWEMWDNGNWSTVLSAWDLDVDLGFAVTYTATTYTTTFSLKLNDVDTDVFDPTADELFVTGSMTGWAIPGSEGSLKLTYDTDAETYTATIELQSGSYEYKYFVIKDGAETWENGEWDGDPNREFTVAEEPITLNDIWGDQPVSVEDIVAFDAQINVYPNPSSGLFNVTASEKVTLEVFDISGRTIRTLNITNGNAQVEIRNAGMYFFRFSNENGSTVNKVIVR